MIVNWEFVFITDNDLWRKRHGEIKRLFVMHNSQPNFTLRHRLNEFMTKFRKYIYASITSVYI